MLNSQQGNLNYGLCGNSSLPFPHTGPAPATLPQVFYMSRYTVEAIRKLIVGLRTCCTHLLRKSDAQMDDVWKNRVRSKIVAPWRSPRCSTTIAIKVEGARFLFAASVFEIHRIQKQPSQRRELDRRGKCVFGIDAWSMVSMQSVLQKWETCWRTDQTWEAT